MLTNAAFIGPKIKQKP